ncbi:MULTISPECIES: hypothetical protein [Streptomycetaceae]|uniref:hypothetical protein n=1 Tax=Streptomycetaceae TaxID=2062 RepID=UPI00037B31D0|nr:MULTISPECIES: hypothetical protein [Streptomycetaceae]MYX38954.1 hypothetical protein [Streptomyces sp. SID8377]
MNPSPSASDGWTALGQDAAHALDRIHAVAPWPLMAVTLLWLANRHPAVYVRVAVALLLSSAAGLALSASMGRVPVRGTSPARDYLADYFALPGAGAGWYLLTALAVVATVPAAWARIAVAAVAASSVAAAVATADDPVAGFLLAAGVPVLAWFTARLVPYRRRVRRAPEAAPLRQAG